MSELENKSNLPHPSAEKLAKIATARTTIEIYLMKARRFHRGCRDAKFTAVSTWMTPQSRRFENGEALGDDE